MIKTIEYLILVHLMMREMLVVEDWCWMSCPLCFILVLLVCYGWFVFAIEHGHTAWVVLLDKRSHRGGNLIVCATLWDEGSKN